MVSKYLTDSKYIFVVSILLAFLLSDFATKLKTVLVPILVFMMTISIKNICFHHITKSNAKNVVYLVAMNYIFLTGLFILFTYLFVENPLYQKSLYILAIMPPAIGVISLSYVLKGDIEVSFIAEFAGYALSLVLVPVLSYFLIGDAVSPFRILEVLVYVIVIPFILSRGLHYIEHKYKLIKKDAVKTIINICYGLFFYILIGINKEILFTEFRSLIPLVIMLFFLKFGVGIPIYLALKNKVKKNMEILFMLFGTMKNGGAATAIAVLLFGVESTVPLAIGAVIIPFYILFMEWFVLRKHA